MVQSKRVVVTGGSGFIGANLVRALLAKGLEVHLLLQSTSDLWRLRDLLPDLFIHHTPLQDFHSLEHVLKKISPSALFHLGAYGASTTHQDHHKMFESNIMGTFYLLKAAETIDYEFFLHVGGSSEYGKKSTSMKEEDVLTPTTFYGATKACSTLLAKQFAMMTQKPIGLLRPFSVYGPFESDRRLIPTTIRAALQDIPVPLTTPGFARDFVFVEDVVEACLLSWEKKTIGEIINIGTGIQTTNEQVIALIEELTGKKIQTIIGAYPPHPSDKPIWVADIAKANELLGWKPKHTLKSGLAKTIARMRTND